MDMYDRDVRDRAVALIERGETLRAVSLQSGVSVRTLREWYEHPGRGRQNLHSVCPRCAEIPSLPEPTRDYAYLLGLYLGDGCISANGALARGIWVLRIACADAWPGLLEECRQAVKAIRPDNKVGTVQSDGCSYVTSYSRHWTCLIPQHGPGKKHDRSIELEPWQRLITSHHAYSFARGLFHSDGCRFTNRVRRPLADGDHWYEYPRYMSRTNRWKSSISVGKHSTILRSAGGSLAGTQSPSPVARR